MQHSVIELGESDLQHEGKTVFSAKMSSSRSDDVTKFVCSFIAIFFSFSVLGVLSSPKEFQWCFKKLLRMFEVSRMFQSSVKGVYK